MEKGTMAYLAQMSDEQLIDELITSVKARGETSEFHMLNTRAVLINRLRSRAEWVAALRKVNEALKRANESLAILNKHTPIEANQLPEMQAEWTPGQDAILQQEVEKAKIRGDAHLTQAFKTAASEINKHSLVGSYRTAKACRRRWYKLHPEECP